MAAKNDVLRGPVMVDVESCFEDRLQGVREGCMADVVQQGGSERDQPGSPV